MYDDIPEKDLNHIKGLAAKYAKKSFYYITFDDLFQEGCMAYLKGKQKYKPEKNDYFMGFIYKRVVGAMLDYIASCSASGSSTVRASGDDSKKVQLVNLNPNLATDESFEDSIIDEVANDMLYERFTEYLKELTQLEQHILVGYFINEKSMVALSAELGISRLKIRRIITACLTYLKNRYKYETINLKFREVSRT
jgi:RNA polymerase sigma factor (sigma-70 family)